MRDGGRSERWKDKIVGSLKAGCSRNEMVSYVVHKQNYGSGGMYQRREVRKKLPLRRGGRTDR